MHTARCLRRLHLLALAVVLGASVAAPAGAQGLSPGIRVRLTAGDARPVGRVERSTADTLVLALSGGGQLALPWSGVERIEHSAGRRGRPGRGAIIGAGVMTAFTLGSIAFGGSEDEVEDDVTDMMLILTLPLNAALGAGIGALGGLAWRTERWSALPVGPASARSRRGPGVTAALRL